MANEQAIRDVVEEVLQQLGKQVRPASGQQPSRPAASAGGAGRGIPVMSGSNGSQPAGGNGHTGYHRGTGNWGVFASVDDAVGAAAEAFEQLKAKSLADRDRAVQIVKDICEQQADELGRMELEETKIGRLDHKIEKLQIIKLVPGVEWLKSDCYSGDGGLTVEEYAPFGVIGAITPVTHSLPTLAGNVVNMVAAGNSLVVNPHPAGARVACEGVRRFNKAIAEAIGVENLVTIMEQPTIESADEIFNHRNVRMLCVTGGPAVARAAMSSRKKAVVAGPGNPPVVVDETADLPRAAKAIIEGAAYDNNLLCIGEKEVFAVESIFDRLLDEMGKAGAYRLTAQQIEQLTKVAFKFVDVEAQDAPRSQVGKHTGTTGSARGKKAVLNKEVIGKDAAELARLIGVGVPSGTQLLYGETGVENPFVPEEQMTTFLPFVRAKNADHAIDLAVEYEHGFGHTAIIHSRDVHNMTKMGRLMDTTLFIKNGPCMAGLGLGGEGYLSFSVATPTGEGVTNPTTFTRSRRCVMVDELRVV